MSSLGIFDKETKTYKKIAGLAEAAVVDDSLSSTSTNPVQNKVVTNNLTDLKYGEVAGGKNLLNPNEFLKLVNKYTIGSYLNDEITISPVSQDLYDNFFKFSDIDIDVTLSIKHLTFNGGTNTRVCLVNSAGTIIGTVTTDTLSVRGIGCGIKLDWSSGPPTSITIKELMVEKGSVATPYEPYIPSIKMLAEENAQQSTEMMDIKMLGWAVPRECPIQNEVNGNQFIQKVGRVDLGSLDWNLYIVERYIFQSNPITNIKSLENISIAPNLYVKGYTTVLSSIKWTNKMISMNHKIIYICDTNYATAEAFKDAMQGQYLYYELATPITKTIDGNEIGETVSDVRKETTVNLLKPTLQTTTLNGVTCTNNGDGTYTLDGTATTGDTFFDLIPWSKIAARNYRIVGCPIGGSKNGYYIEVNAPKTTEENTYYKDIGNGVTFETYDKAENNIVIRIRVNPGITVSNLVFKPMLTTNLSATYEDFVPYTGDTGKLNGDVAELKAEVANKTIVDATMSDTSTNPVQNKVVTSNLVDLKKETTVNLLNPTLETTTQDGITCTNNGDGTYTLNGTVSTHTNRAVIVIQYWGDIIKKHLNEELLLIGCPKHDKSINVVLHLDGGTSHAADNGNGDIFKFSQVAGNGAIKIEIGPNGTTVNNLVFKPMITTNLNATYDDFVPYTGDTGKLNRDVAVLAKKIPKFERNSTVFASSGLFLTGDTAGRFGAISDEWSDTYGREIQFSNSKDAKTNCSVWVDIPAHSVGLFEAYTKDGTPVVVKTPLFFYNERATAQRETISCDITTSVGATVTIVFNPIVIKNV